MNDAQVSAIVLITRLARAVHRRAGPGQLGMTLKEFTVLSALRDSGGVGQRELGEAMLLDANSISMLLTGLEDRGLLTRTPDRADRRRYWVTLTDAGEAEFQRAESAMGDAGTVVLGSLSPAEISLLSELAAKALETPGDR